MLGIEIYNEFLDLGDNGCTIELINPIFSEDITNGSGSYDLSIPATERNNRLLGNINQVATTKRFVNIPCNIYLSRQCWKSGILVLDTTKLYDSYSARFDVDVPILKTVLQETMIDSFDYGVDNVIISRKYLTIRILEPTFIWYPPLTIYGPNNPSGLLYQFYNYSGSIGSPVFYTEEESAQMYADAINAEVNRDVNARYQSDGTIILEPIDPGNVIQVSISINAFKYYLGPLHITAGPASQLLADLSNYNERHKDMADKITQLMMTDFVPNQDIVFPMIYNPDFYSENSVYEQFINNYTSGGLGGGASGYFCNQYDATTNPVATQYPIVPMIRLAKIIDAIKTMPDITFQGGFFDDASIFDYIYVYNNYALDKVVYLDYPTLEQKFNIWDDTITIANHIPRISVLETIKTLAQATGYRIFYNGNTITLKSLDEILDSSDYIDDTFKANPIPTKTNNQFEGIALKYDSGDDGFAKQLDTSTYNYLGEINHFPTTPQYNDLFFWTGDKQFYAFTGQVVFDATLNPVSDGDWKVVGNEYVEAYLYGSAPYSEKQLLIPALTELYYAGTFGVQISQKGSSNFLQQGINKVDKLYLMKMQSFGSFPIARKIDMNDLFILQKKWADFQIKSCQITRDINFNLLDLLNFDFTKKRRINDTEYLYHTVRFQIKGKQISSAQVYLYPDLR